MVIRGTTPYFLGDVLKARYEELEALYKLFPNDPLFAFTPAVVFR